MNLTNSLKVNFLIIRHIKNTFTILNLLFAEVASKSSRSHHNPTNGSYKWQATISNSFDKLVKLAHQLEPTREENELSSTEITHKPTSKRKRSHKSVSEGKPTPDTPPRSPSSTNSLERPLTPSTPSGLAPLAENISETVSEVKKIVSDTLSRVSRVETPSSISTETSSTPDSLEDLKVRKVSRPPKKNVSNGIWMDSNGHYNQPAININNHFINALNNQNHSSGVLQMNKQPPVPNSNVDPPPYAAYRHINPPRSDGYHHFDGQPPMMSYSQNHSVIQSNKTADLLLSKACGKLFSFPPPFSQQYSAPNSKSKKFNQKPASYQKFLSTLYSAYLSNRTEWKLYTSEPTTF